MYYTDTLTSTLPPRSEMWFLVGKLILSGVLFYTLAEGNFVNQPNLALVGPLLSANRGCLNDNPQSSLATSLSNSGVSSVISTLTTTGIPGPSVSLNFSLHRSTLIVHLRRYVPSAVSPAASPVPPWFPRLQSFIRGTSHWQLEAQIIASMPHRASKKGQGSGP
jgi:hypothetical protein